MARKHPSGAVEIVDEDGYVLNLPDSTAPGQPSERVIAVQGAAGMVPVVSVGQTILAFATFSRPANTTQYASGDLVANSATAAAVVPLIFQFAGRPDHFLMIRRGTLWKNDDDVTAATFRLHLFDRDPTRRAPSNGDNGAIQLNGAIEHHRGSLDFDMTASPDIHADGNMATGIPVTGTEIIMKADARGNVYGLLEARATYTPVSAERFTAMIASFQD